MMDMHAIATTATPRRTGFNCSLISLNKHTHTSILSKLGQIQHRKINDTQFVLKMMKFYGFYSILSKRPCLYTVFCSFKYLIISCNIQTNLDSTMSQL